MFTSLLCHAYGLKGYEYVRTIFCSGGRFISRSGFLVIGCDARFAVRGMPTLAGSRSGDSAPCRKVADKFSSTTRSPVLLATTAV